MVSKLSVRSLGGQGANRTQFSCMTDVFPEDLVQSIRGRLVACPEHFVVREHAPTICEAVVMVGSLRACLGKGKNCQGGTWLT